MAIRKSSTSGVPFGNTANRPTNPQVGQTYYNGELGYQEIYTTAGWIPASGGNDFNLNLGGTYTTVTFSQSYGSGAYSVVSSNNDTTLDIYAYASDGSLAGYSATKSFNATQRFNKMVVIGGQQGDVLTFSYKTTFATTNTTSEIAAGPFITAVSPSSMPNANDTITITGGNFANDVQVAFTGSGYSSTQAKNIVRSSASSLIVTRPDNLPVSGSPYTLTITNPGVPAPVSTNIHISSNSITAGIGPVWNTTSPLPTFTRNVSYSTVLSATDADTNGSVTYSLVSGSLPSGLTLSSLTGGISGTPTDGIAQTFTVRATDAGGNYVDRAFTIPNTAPVWSTAATLPTFTRNSAYSTTLVATDDSGNNPTYSIVSGSLPTGLTLSSAGVISGTPTSSTNATFTVRATDANGNTADRAFTMPNIGPTWVTSAGAITAGFKNSAYSFTFSATDDSGVAPTYSILSGSLPTGLSLSSAGVISGTPTVFVSTNTPASFTVSAIDANGNTADRAFTMVVGEYAFSYINSTSSWTVPSGVTSIDYIIVAGGGSGAGAGGNVGASGGGAGGVLVYTGASVTPGASMPATIGGGGVFNRSVGDSGYGTQGGNTTFNGVTVTGGGGGGSYSGWSNTGVGSGGSGGGAEGGGNFTGGSGISGQGNNGGSRTGQYDGGGGGGKGSAGVSGTQGGSSSSGTAGAGGSAYVWLDGQSYGGGGGATGSNGSSVRVTSNGGTNAGNGQGGNAVGNRGGGGGGTSGGSGGSGGSGVVAIRYIRNA
jgi:hypothetical protein